MNFSSDAMADFEGLLEVNRKICKTADGGKGFAYAANELCGIALNSHYTRANELVAEHRIEFLLQRNRPNHE